MQKNRLIFYTIICIIFVLSAPLNEVFPEGKGFRPNFRNTDIEDFLKSMSGIIGKNIVMDDRVKGKITIISPEYIQPKLAYSYLTTVLALKGFGVLDTGTFLKIVPIKDAIAESPIILLGRETIDQNVINNNNVVTHIVPTYMTKPSRLSGILKRITDANTDLVDFDESSMLIITGNAPEVSRLVRIIAEIDPEGNRATSSPESFGNIHIYPLHNMSADKLEATLRKISMPESGQNFDPTKQSQGIPVQRQGVVPGALASKIDIVGHKETNSMIYVGTEDDFRTIRKLIENLDQPRDQVLLELLIIEVAADKTNDFGIDWKAGTGQFNSHILETSGLLTKGIAGGTPNVSGINTLSGFSLGFINSSVINITSLLSVNMSKSNFVILSAPQILTLDNQEAEINVGEDVPVITGQRTSGADVNTVSINNYEYKPVGIKVKFTPQISNSEMVTLDLYQEIKSIAGYTTDSTKNPTFTKRDIKTAIRVADGQTIVIGGLISNNKTQNITKIPILGDIPIIGFLFKRQSTVFKRTNLLVFITPHILTNKDLADKVTDEAKTNQINESKRINADK
ncbi:MAG: type II secretion system protein GspD [Spirochaetia bacterium]|nr:type II secretion system protein GspD [Spirochaetia bacterium]